MTQLWLEKVRAAAKQLRKKEETRGGAKIDEGEEERTIETR